MAKRRRTRRRRHLGAHELEHFNEAKHDIDVARRTVAQLEDALSRGSCLSAKIVSENGFRMVGRAEVHLESIHGFQDPELETRELRSHLEDAKAGLNGKTREFEVKCLRSRGRR